MASDLWRNIFIAFKESEESLEQLLLAGKIPQDAFLSWASETYKVPFLDKSFFSQLTKFDLLLTYPSATWTANFFPVFEWEEVIYVVCLEPGEVNLPKKHCFVLAPIHEMHDAWNKMEKAADTSGEPHTFDFTASSILIEPLSLEAPSVAPTTASDDPAPEPDAEPKTSPHLSPLASESPALDGSALSFLNLELSAPPPPVEPAPTPNHVVSEALPELFPIEESVTNIKAQEPAEPLVLFDDVLPVTPSTKPPTTPITAETKRPMAGTPPTKSTSSAAPRAPGSTPSRDGSRVAPASPSKSPSQSAVKPPVRPTPPPSTPTPTAVRSNSGPTPPPPPSSFRAQPLSAMKAPEAPLTEDSMFYEQSKSQFIINPNMTATAFRTTEPTKAGSPAREMTFTNTKTIMPFPESTRDFTFIRTVYSDHIISEARSKVEDNQDPQEALISAFKILRNFYKRMMWVVRDQQGRAFPIACNDAWSFSEQAWQTPINFKAPNPFRLAKFTQKPFHGPVAKSPVNDAYFKQWNSAEYPDIMTIVPIKMQGKVFGYLVGCDTGPHFHARQTLEIMETTAKELVQTFLKIHSPLGRRKAS